MMMIMQETLISHVLMLARWVTVMDMRFTKKVDNDKAVATKVA